jgi:hypothetical protein
VRDWRRRRTWRRRTMTWAERTLAAAIAAPATRVWTPSRSCSVALVAEGAAARRLGGRDVHRRRHRR